MRVSAVNAVVLVSSCLAVPVFGQLASQDAANIWNDFNATFYSSGDYKWQEGGSYDKNDRWENAEMLEMATDCYIAAPTGANENIVSNLFNAFDSSYTSDWTSDEYNDDIMWCVLAHARAYLAIYNETKTVTPSMTKWGLYASNNFCWVYNGGHSPGRVNPQYDTNLGGGMWWTYEILSGNTNWNSFFNNQAKAAWAVTNASGLSWDDWLPTTNTPASGLYSWDCSPSVVALQWVQIAQSTTAPLVPLQESLTFTANNGQRQLNWIYGTLQSATNISGPYTVVPNASPPYTIPTTGAWLFYRVRED